MLTIFQNGLSAASIQFLSADKETSGVSKVNVSQFCIVVDCTRVDQVHNWLHVLIAGFYIHVETSDDPRTSLAVEQKEVFFGLCKEASISFWSTMSKWLNLDAF